MERGKVPELRRTAVIQAAVTPSQRERIKAAAAYREMMTSEFLRGLALAEVERIEKEQARRQRGTK